MNLLATLSLALLVASPAFATDREDDDRPCRREHSFGWQVQGSLPVKDFKDRLDQTAIGIGFQWNHGTRDTVVHRTRLELNSWREGNPVGPLQTKTETRNIVLSFDRLFPLRTDGYGPYVAFGLGAVRWHQQQTNTVETTTIDATKLLVMAGIGMNFNRNISFEARYNVGGLHKSLDSSHMQACLSIRY